MTRKTLSSLYLDTGIAAHSAITRYKRHAQVTLVTGGIVAAGPASAEFSEAITGLFEPASTLMEGLVNFLILFVLVASLAVIVWKVFELISSRTGVGGLLAGLAGLAVAIVFAGYIGDEAETAIGELPDGT